MALTALIIASDGVGGADDILRATLPMLGRTLIEYQVRQAIAAGAAHVVVLVERMPAALMAAMDRLRHDAIAVDVARGIADAADRFHPDERLLLIADGCVADAAMLDALTRWASPLVVTVPDHGDTAAHERIDAGHRWSGLALLDGAAIRATAAMLGDWDPQSTLLRRAVQGGAARIDAADLPGARPRLLTDAAALEEIDRALIRASRSPESRWSRRWFGIVDGPVAGWLARRAVDPLVIAVGASVAAVLGAVLVWSRWRIGGAMLGLLSGPAWAIGLRLARLRLASIRRGAVLDGVRVAALASGLIGIGVSLGDWGWSLAAGGAGVTMLAKAGLERALGGQSGPVWIADADALCWTFALSASVAGWAIGLGVAVLYALLSYAGIHLATVATLADRPRRPPSDDRSAV